MLVFLGINRLRASGMRSLAVELAIIFVSGDLKRVMSTNHIKLHRAGVLRNVFAQCHGTVDSSHGSLRRIYRLFSEKYDTHSDNIKLRFTGKALNDTARSRELVLLLLVFGKIP